MCNECNAYLTNFVAKRKKDTGSWVTKNGKTLIFRAKNWPRLIHRVGLLAGKYGKWMQNSPCSLTDQQKHRMPGLSSAYPMAEKDTKGLRSDETFVRKA